MKGLLAAAAACAALATGMPASAAQAIFLKTDGIYNPGTATVTPPGKSSEYVYSGPVWFEGDLGSTATGSEFDFLGFCVDVFHNISAGINGQANLDLAYQSQPLIYDGNGDVLGGIATAKIANLVTIGTNLWNAAGGRTHVDGTLSNQLSSIQDAIWVIEGSTVTGGGSLTNFYANLAAPTHPGIITAVYNYNPSLKALQTTSGNQGFVFAGGVPEPATWGLMIVGFGGIGATLRRRRIALA